MHGTWLKGILASATFCYSEVDLLQLHQTRDLIILEAMHIKRYVIPIPVTLKTCIDGLTIPDCLDKYMRLLPLHNKSKNLELWRTVEWILANDKTC